MKLNLNRDPKEDAIIWYSQKNLKDSLRVEMDKRGWKLNGFNKIVKKTVDAKTKAGFKPCFYTHEIDQYFAQASFFADTKSYA